MQSVFFVYSDQTNVNLVFARAPKEPVTPHMNDQAKNLAPARKLLRKFAASNVREIEMKQGNKITRMLAWIYG